MASGAVVVRFFRRAARGPYLGVALAMALLGVVALAPGTWGTAYGDTGGGGGSENEHPGSANHEDTGVPGCDEDQTCAVVGEQVGQGVVDTFVCADGMLILVNHGGQDLDGNGSPDGQPVFAACQSSGNALAPGGAMGLMRISQPAAVDVPGNPLGLRQISAANVQIQPIGTPNYVDLTLRYNFADLAGLSESALRMFYYDDRISSWVELPASIDPVSDTLTVYNVDVAAFANALHRVGILG